jgi:YD repeat-containing protein
MKTRALLGAVCVILVILGCTQRSTSQAAPGVFADAYHPNGAPDPERLDQIWQVDPITGSVSITIPFTTTPAGGRGPNIPFSIHYNSSSTVTLQSDFDVVYQQGDAEAMGGLPWTSTLEFYAWSTGDLQAPSTPSQSPLGPWGTSGPFFYNHRIDIPDQQYTYDLPGTGAVVTPNYSGCSIAGPFIYTDASGAAHDMNLESANASLNGTMANACSTAYYASQTYGSNYYTTDGSALATTVSPTSVTQPDGTVVSESGSGATLEDSNGNQATFGLNASGAMAATDSLGRTAFSTTIPIDYMGQIPVGTYNVTTTGASGNSESYTVMISQISIGSFNMPHPVGGAGYAEYTGNNTSLGIEQPTAAGLKNTLPVVSSIMLPDSTQYTFNYDSTYGTISKIEFPTGGYVRFVWGIRNDGGGNATFLKLSTLVATEACTSTGSGVESCWQYSFPDYSSTTGLTSKVTAPDGSYTRYTGVGLNFSAVPISYTLVPTWKEGSRFEYNSSGTLMKSVATGYVEGLTAQVATTFYDDPTPLQQYVQYGYDRYLNVVEKDESAFYSCTSPCSMPSSSTSFPWLRRTFTTYLGTSAFSVPGQPAYNYLQAYIVDRPSQVLVTDGSGHPFSLVQYLYDQTSLSGPAGIMNHDDANYSASPAKARGNLTTENHCATLAPSSTVSLATAASFCTTWLKTTHTYDITGQVTSTTDPKGNTPTTFSYVDKYVSGAPAKPTNGYVTTVTHPYGYVDTSSYYYPTGGMANHKDWNNNTTTYLYNDPGNMHRPTEVQYPDGGDVQIGYVDLPPFSVASTTKTGGTGGPIVKTTLYDGLGRTYQTQVNASTSETDYVNTTYDLMGRVQSVTNPYRTTSDPTYGITSYLYDALGRKIDQCQPDNTGAPSATCVPTNSYESWSYKNNSNAAAICVVSQDENKNQWQRCSNGLGQLTSVLEPNGSSSSPSMETDYLYDPLNNLLSATQCGATCPGTNARVRSFTYDNLSRLLTSSNPETGTVCYGLWSGSACLNGYDGDGNLHYKTDARGVITAYGYDQLNRVISKNFSNDASGTPLSCYQYDTSSATPSRTPPNWIGRLTNQWTQSVSAGACLTAPPTTGFYTKQSILAYDQMGRILSEQQYTPATIAGGTPYAPQYQYDLAGNLVYSTDGATPTPTPSVQPPSCAFSPYPSWVTLTFANCLDGAGRLQTQASNWVDTTHPQLLFSVPTYAAFGGLTSASFGNGLTLGRTFDNRLREDGESDKGSIVTSSTPGSTTVTITGSEQSQ